MAVLDRTLFHLLNGTLVSPWLDAAMPVITNGRVWAVILVLIGLWLVLRGGRRGRLAALTLVVTLALSDVTTSQVLKPAFGRGRPCHALRDARLLVRCGGRNGFPSNHAANGAGVAVVLGSFYPATCWVCVPAALVVSWSRVYVGVHYPGDVLAGMLLGAVVGGGAVLAARRRWPGLDLDRPPGKAGRIGGART